MRSALHNGRTAAAARRMDGQGPTLSRHGHPYLYEGPNEGIATYPVFDDFCRELGGLTGMPFEHARAYALSIADGHPRRVKTKGIAHAHYLYGIYESFGIAIVDADRVRDAEYLRDKLKHLKNCVEALARSGRKKHV